MLRRLAPGVAERRDHVAGQLPLELEPVLVGGRPLQVAAVAVGVTEIESTRWSQLVQLHGSIRVDDREIAVEVRWIDSRVVPSFPQHLAGIAPRFTLPQA